MTLLRQLHLGTRSRSVLASFALFASCSQLPVEGEVLERGVAARVVRESVGGIASLRVRTELDSASAAWVTTTCPMHLDAAACARDGTTTRGTASAAAVTALYTTARTDAFRALKSRYEPTGQVADGMAHTLIISGEGRTRRLEWADGANLPAALDQFSAELHQVTTGS